MVRIFPDPFRTSRNFPDQSGKFRMKPSDDGHWRHAATSSAPIQHADVANGRLGNPWPCSPALHSSLPTHLPPLLLSLALSRSSSHRRSPPRIAAAWSRPARIGADSELRRLLLVPQALGIGPGSPVPVPPSSVSSASVELRRARFRRLRLPPPPTSTLTP